MSPSTYSPVGDLDEEEDAVDAPVDDSLDVDPSVRGEVYGLVLELVERMGLWV